MYTALIVDDEKPQQELLLGMLENHFPQINVLDVCGSVKVGFEKINQWNPQLVFLDVSMPPQTGFDMLNLIEQINFEIIFITAYQEFALRAFRVSAVDYLLKPYSVDDLKTAIKKFEQRFAQKDSFQHIQSLLQNVNASISPKTQIALPTNTGFMFVEMGTISHCMSTNAYTTFWFADKSSIIICKPIGDCEELLKGLNFVRIHKSIIINLLFLKEYIRGDGGQVRMLDGTFLNVSRNHKDDLMKAINKI